MQVIQLIQVILFSTITIVTAAAGGYCLVQGINGFVKVRNAQNTEVKIGPHLFIKTPAPALVICFFGLILFLIVARLVEDKIKISKLNDTVSKQSSELAELQKKNEQLDAELRIERLREEEVAEKERGLRAEQEKRVHAKFESPKELQIPEGREQEKVHAKLESPKEEPQMPRSEMGTLIARNHDEIEQLRRTTDCDYFEFTIEEGEAREVGHVTIELKSINPKKNLFTIDVKADGGAFEKKNHSVNKPIFFFATEDHSVALELVVNKLTKNQATGYLSVPKGTQKPAKSGTSG